MAGIAKRRIIPTHINAAAIHNGPEPLDKVDEANRPKRGSWKKSMERKSNKASPRVAKLI